jgi:tetrahydromethanopterin S-methyltransferase subunit B
MIPAANVFWPSIPGYESVPYPSTAVANLIHGFLFGGDVLVPAGIAGLFALVVGVAWILQSRTDVFPNLRATMRLAFGQADLRKTAMQQEALTRGLSGLTRRVSVDLMKGSPVGMMTRFHLIRILRDGSILMIGLLTGMLVVLGAANRIGEAPPSDVSILTTGWAGLMIPVILSFNWNATEKPNLWTVAMAPRYLGTYLRGFYRAASAVTVVSGVVGALAFGIASPMGIVAAVAMAIAAAGAAVSVVAAVRIPSDAFSLRSMIPFLVVPPAALAAGAPVVALSVFASGLGPSVWSVGAIYVGVVFLLFDGLPVRAARRFQL